MTDTTETQHGTIGVDGATLAYDVAGEGPPLVLMHPGVSDRTVWDDVWEPFAQRHRVVRYDTRGFGETRATADVPFSNRADLRAVLDHLGIDRAAVIGASRSGVIALDTAIESPERVSALVHVGGGVSGFDGGSTPEEDAIWAEADRIEAARDWPAMVDLELRAWYDGIGQPETRLPAAIRERGRRMLEAIYRDHADDPLDQVIPLVPPAVGRLAEIRCPVLVLAGELDESGTVAAGRYLAEHAPNARRVEWPGVAHVPWLERPAEFVALVEEFLAAS